MPGLRFWLTSGILLLYPEYLKHKSCWDAIDAQGWTRGLAPERPGYTGMIIKRGEHEHAIYVRSTTAEKVHAELLRECEEYVGDKPELVMVKSARV